MALHLFDRLPPGPQAAVDLALDALDDQAGLVVFAAPGAGIVIVARDVPVVVGGGGLDPAETLRGRSLIDLLVIERDAWRSLLCRAGCCAA